MIELCFKTPHLKYEQQKIIKIATKNCGGLHEKIFKLQNEIKTHKVQLKKESEYQKKHLAHSVGSVQKNITNKTFTVRRTLKVLTDNQKFYNSEMYGIETSQYSFYVQDLISKALLQERLIPRNGKEPSVTKLIEITTYGEEFLKYLEEN